MGKVDSSKLNEGELKVAVVFSVAVERKGIKTTRDTRQLLPLLGAGRVPRGGSQGTIPELQENGVTGGRA